MRSWELLAAMILAAACSVKEDRAFCPAWCVVYSDGYVADGCRGELTCNVATDAKSSFEYGKQDFMRFARRGDLVLEVPRGEQVYVDVFCGVKGMERNGSENGPAKPEEGAGQQARPRVSGPDRQRSEP